MPNGVTRIAKGLAEAFSDDVSIRQTDENITAAATRLKHTISTGTVWCSTKQASKSPHLPSITET